jgi:hypothetical protein
MNDGYILSVMIDSIVTNTSNVVNREFSISTLSVLHRSTVIYTQSVLNSVINRVRDPYIEELPACQFDSGTLRQLFAGTESKSFVYL